MQGISGPSDRWYAPVAPAEGRATSHPGNELPATVQSDAWSPGPRVSLEQGAPACRATESSAKGAPIRPEAAAVSAAASVLPSPLGPALASAAGSLPEPSPNPAPSYDVALIQSPVFARLDPAVQRLARKALAFLGQAEGQDVKQSTRAQLEPRGLHGDADGRANITGLATSEGFAALAPADQRKLLISACGAGSSHVLLTFVRQRLESAPPEQQKALLEKLVQDLPLPTRLEDPPRAEIDGHAVVDHGEMPCSYQAPDGSYETRSARAYQASFGGQAITIAIPLEAPGDPRLRVPGLEQIVRALASLPTELRQGIEAVAVQPARKIGITGREVAALADSGFTGSPGVLRFFPSEDWDQALVDATMTHEAGHVLSTREWGKAGRFFKDATPSPGWARWQQAMSADPVAPSGYARTSPTEDLSETLRALSLVRGTPLEEDLRALLPHRFEVVDALLPGWSGPPTP